MPVTEQEIRRLGDYVGATPAPADFDAFWCYIPPLTTIKQDFRLLGQTSVDRLLKLSQGQAVKSNQLLPVSLVKRKTTLAPNTQTTSPRTLADSLMQLARQVSRLESGQ